jgi:PH and SEC7 domain-containing protein
LSITQYIPHTANYKKATQNWKNKSQYLTSEIVKYDIYVDALNAAMALRHKKRGEKALERALVSVEDDSNTKKTSGKLVSSPEAQDENSTPVPGRNGFSTN